MTAAETIAAGLGVLFAVKLIRDGYWFIRCTVGRARKEYRRARERNRDR